MKRKQDYIIIVGLAFITLLLIYAIIPAGHLFGSETDWLSQHITLADTIRQRFYQTHDLFMDYLPQLGGGQNVYQISYYGLFRPDVLLSLLLPSMAMKDIIITGIIVNSVCSVVFCFIWLRKHATSSLIAMMVSLLLLCSGPLLFHAHRQLMFVNYMPWLFMGLIAIDSILTKHSGNSILTISVILMILNSYFYSVGAIIVLLIYAGYQIWIRNKQKFLKQWLTCMVPIVIGILICGILLFPTFMAMLESERSGGTLSIGSLLIPNLTLHSLLYQSYGAGVTIIVWAMLVVGWLHIDQSLRIMSRILTIVFIFPIIPYVMNGGLYARAKILIVFLPFLMYYVALYLKQMKQKPLCLWHLPFIAMPLIVSAWKKDVSFVLLIDTVLSLVVLFLLQQTRKQQVFLLMNGVALLSCLQVNRGDNFVSKEKYEAIYDPEKEQLLSKHIKADGRFEDFTYSMNTSNLIQTDEMYKPSYYSSIKNSTYNAFFYDVLKSPISIKNRVAMVSSNQVFLQGMMGTRYVFNKDYLPAGYRTLGKTAQGILGENLNVMPIAYATADLMSEQTFKQYQYPQSLDMLYNHAIVSDTKYQQAAPSSVQVIPAPFILEDGKNVSVESLPDGYLIQAKKDTKITIPITPQSEQDICMVQFDVIPKKVATNKNISISLNGIKNTLSSVDANYPNGNTTFHYTLSSNQAVQELHVSFSKGTYELRNMKYHAMKLDAIQQRHNQVDEMNVKASTGKAVLTGSITVSNTGYLVTSLPYQNGYQVKVDGKVIPVEKVNTAFVGFPISQGKHNVVIAFHAPGKTIGWIMSGSGLILWCGYTLERSYYERKKRNI